MRRKRMVGDGEAWRRWSSAWFRAAGIAVVNGALREAFYRDAGDTEAHQVSTGTLIAALVAYMWSLEQRWPIPDQRTALTIGSTWAVATIAFEVGLGRFLGPSPTSWSDLLSACDITKGQLWPLVIVTMLFGPLAIRSARMRQLSKAAGRVMPSVTKDRR